MRQIPTSSKELQVKRIYELVGTYRGQDDRAAQKAAQELLELFAPYLERWQKLLLYGRGDPNNRDVRTLLSLYGCQQVSDLGAIRGALLRVLEPDDIRQETRLVLLECFQRYGNLQHYAHRLQQHIQAILRDRVMTQSSSIEEENVEVEAHRGGRVEEEIDQQAELFWQNAGWKQLTAFEREVVRLRFSEGHSIQETSDILGVGTSTIKRTINLIRQTLQASGVI